jgi:hypothetical protein
MHKLTLLKGGGIMANMAGKVCLNHTSTPAVSRCETCFKPLCEDCILEVEGSHFCSEKCAGDGIDKKGRIAVLDSVNQKSKMAAFVGKIIVLLILLGLAYAGYVYWQNNQSKMDKFKRDAQKALQNAGKKAEAVKDAATK